MVRLGERLHPGNTTLKANKLETASVEVDTISTFRTTWFERLEYLHQITTENSGLECASRCTARCCPQSVASIDPADAVGHVAIMLPFEMEYLISKMKPQGKFALSRLPQRSANANLFQQTSTRAQSVDICSLTTGISILTC